MPASAHGIGLQVPSQYVPVVHRFPHAPQCSGLLNVLTQAPPQQTRPWGPQPASHPPPLEPLPLDDPLLTPPELLLPPLDVLPTPELPEPDPDPPPLDDDDEDEDEDEELASSDVPSIEASTPELKVEPPQDAPTTAMAQSTEEMGRIFCIDASSFERPIRQPMKRHTPPLQVHPPKLGCGHELQSRSAWRKARFSSRALILRVFMKSIGAGSVPAGGNVARSLP